MVGTDISALRHVGAPLVSSPFIVSCLLSEAESSETHVTTSKCEIEGGKTGRLGYTLMTLPRLIHKKGVKSVDVCYFYFSVFLDLKKIM